MITYKNISDIFQDIATNHYLINSYHNGFLDEVDVDKMNESNFPILYVEPSTATIDQGVLTYSCNVYVLNLLKEDLSNREEVWSSTLEIMQDIIAEFKQNLSLQRTGGDSGKKYSYAENEIVLELPISTDPITARFANILTGWVSGISLQVNNANSLCNAPIEPSDKNANI
tara:strand:- start:8181 stop:8693 length:513 start_codon:yes stop_codon:yes gene_type:complete